VERNSLAVEVRQFEIGRFISGVNFSHRLRKLQISGCGESFWTCNP
jgi:hypothetical protein